MHPATAMEKVHVKMLADAHAPRQHVLLPPERAQADSPAARWQGSDLEVTADRQPRRSEAQESRRRAACRASIPSPHAPRKLRTTDPESLARLYSCRAEAEDAAWRAKRKVEDDEQLDVELDAFTSAVADSERRSRTAPESIGRFAPLPRSYRAACAGSYRTARPHP